jgi:NAD(P)H-dependent flavin oxidoreductase YrpB (nitropropane dioxygenase family)
MRTRLCDLLGIEHPVGLGGMGSVDGPALVAAVSEAGGIGMFGASHKTPAEISASVAAIRGRTRKPFGLNFLLFCDNEAGFAAALEQKPAVLAFAWPRGDQDLKPWFDRAHRAGAKVTFMAGNVPDAKRGAAAGADVIIAQGTEGGGHVGWMASMVLTPMVVDAVAPVPVMAAGGIADGRGLAAALALGAEGALLGTRFLATEESPLHPNFKRALVEHDGHDTVLTEIPDLARGMVWPGAMSRAIRNRFVERWSGREWVIRHHRAAIWADVEAARQRGDADEAPLSAGQDAGLIRDIPPAGEIVRRMVAEADVILTKRLAAMARS